MPRRLRVLAVAAVLLLAGTAGANRLFPSVDHATARTDAGVALLRTGPALAPTGATRHARERVFLLVAVLAALALVSAPARRAIRHLAVPTRTRSVAGTALSRAPPILPVTS